MKYQLLLLLVFAGPIFSQAQDFQGIAIYQSKTTIDLNLQGREIPEDRKQRIRERLKNAMNRTYELKFNKVASIYVQEEKLETSATSDGQGRGRFGLAFGGTDGELYTNIQEKRYANQSELFGKVFLIKDSLTQWNWKLSSETKKIGNYTVYKATALQKIDSTPFERLRRRRPDARNEKTDRSSKGRAMDTARSDSTRTNALLSRIEAPKERTVTAWYAPEIPISQGPAGYWGLPGLILEVNDGRTAILCTKIILNPEDKVKVKIPSKGKVVNQEEYDKITSEKMGEMSERFRRGNRRSGGNGIRPRG